MKCRKKILSEMGAEIPQKKTDKTGCFTRGIPTEAHCEVFKELERVLRQQKFLQLLPGQHPAKKLVFLLFFLLDFSIHVSEICCF